MLNHLQIISPFGALCFLLLLLIVASWTSKFQHIPIKYLKESEQSGGGGWLLETRFSVA